MDRSRLKALGMLAIPLIAIAVTVVALTWGHSSSQDTEATSQGTVDLSLSVINMSPRTIAGNPSGITTKCAATKCTVTPGASFLLAVSANTIPDDPDGAGPLAAGYIGISAFFDW